MSREIQTIPITFANSGIVIKSAADGIPESAYKMLSNVQTDKENSLSVRKGFVRLNDGLSDKPHSAYFLKDYLDRQWRYAIVDGQLYVAPVTDPDDASVWPIALSNQFATVNGAGNLSTEQDPRALFCTYSLSGSEMKPYIFLADSTAFLKHPGGMADARRVGIPAPIAPISNISTGSAADELLEDFEDYTEWTGGDSTLTSAPNYPGVWNYLSSTLDARYYYMKYTFTLNDNSETYASGVGFPHYVPSGKAARVFWKTHEEEFSQSALAHAYTVGTYFNEDTGNQIPEDGARLSKIRHLVGEHLHRIQPFWTLNDGTVQEGGHHGGAEGGEEDFELDFDEYITSIKMGYGIQSYLVKPFSGDNIKIDWIQYVTNKRTSDKFGGDAGTSPYEVEISVPSVATDGAYSLVGFHGYYGDGNSAYQADILNLGFIWRKDTFDTSVTAPGAAIGWNLYIGEDPGYLRKVNDDPISLANYYDEPTTGPSYEAVGPPLPNVGDLSDDVAGETDNALKMDINGAGVAGRALKIFTNAAGYPVVKDLGTTDPEESIKLSIKFEDSESKDNCAALNIKFILSDYPGDIGDRYQYYAIATITDFNAYTPGSFYQETFFKSDFVFNNSSGLVWSNLGWDTVTAVEIEVITKDPATGSENCNLSFDNLYYSPVGKLTGSDFIWTYTYYNTKTDTESDYADPFANPLGPLVNQIVTLTIPQTPYTNAPLANPDKIRLYRMGGTIEQFQYVKSVDYIPGFESTIVDNVSDDLLGDELETDNQLPPDNVEGCEIYDNRMWVWGGDFDGVSEPSNRLRFSKGTRIEHFPAANYIYVGSGNERIMRVLEHDGELFVFTATRVYRIVGQSAATYRAVSTAVNQGLTNKFCAVRGFHGLYMRAYDGIYEFPSGKKISEPINQVFFGEEVNGIEPVASGREGEEAMGFYDSKLFFSYCSTSDTSYRNDRTLIFDTLYNRWYWYIYGAQSLFTEPENNILVGCNLTQWYNKIAGSPVDIQYSGAWTMRMEYGYADQMENGFRGIPCVIDTREYDLGMADQEKQFIDLTVDADTKGYPILVQMSFDGQTHETLGVVQTTERARTILPIILGDGNSRYAVRASLRINFETDVNATSSTRIYKVAHRVLPEPVRHGTFVTDWSNYGYAGPKYFHKLWIEMDTFGQALTSIEVQMDGVVAKTLTSNITANGRRKLYYGLGVDLRGIITRLKFNVPDGQEVKVYDHGFDMINEPPLVNTLQTEWTDVGYPYRKLWKHVELDIDTEGKLIDFDFWVDGTVQQTFSISTDNGRERVIQSFDQEIFGKIGRITVDVTPVDTDGVLQGVRSYADPLYAVEQRHPEVTISDSFEHTLDNERVKVLRKLWYVIDNPNADVSLTVYVDNVEKDTFTISVSTINPKLQKRRIDFPSGYKGRLMRFVFTSKQAFEVDWPKSQVVTRDINPEEGYRHPRLNPPATW